MGLVCIRLYSVAFINIWINITWFEYIFSSYNWYLDYSIHILKIAWNCFCSYYHITVGRRACDWYDLGKVTLFFSLCYSRFHHSRWITLCMAFPCLMARFHRVISLLPRIQSSSTRISPSSSTCTTFQSTIWVASWRYLFKTKIWKTLCAFKLGSNAS